MSEMDHATENVIQRIPIAEWQVQTLRFTAFPTEPIGVDVGSSWWNEIFGEPPDTASQEPRRARAQVHGPFQSGTAVLQTQPARIDWRLTMVDPEESELPSLGNYIQNRDAFGEFVTRWLQLEDCPILTRLAFGAILMFPVDSREAGYSQLQPYLPAVELDPIHSSDFQYRINRPRVSTLGIAELGINRLSTWSVMYVQSATLHLGSDGASQRVGERRFACRLELDINTAPDPEITLDPSVLPKVYRELVTSGDEIVQMGDIR